MSGVPGSLVGVLFARAQKPRGRLHRAQPFPAIPACVIFLGAYVLIATDERSAALGGAALILTFGTDAHGPFYSEKSSVDWNVIFLPLGMMAIVSVMRETGKLRAQLERYDQR